MSTGDLRARTGRTRERLRRVRASVAGAILGDAVGAAVFFGALCVLALYWRTGVFITDTNTLANALVGLADGHLHVDRVPYGGRLDSPGTVRVDGRVYGRNYGQLAVGLVFLWGLRAVAAVAELRIALAATWSLSLLAFAVSLGRALDRRVQLPVAGSVAAVALFALNVRLATPVDPALRALLALQLGALVATALIGVVIYRLVSAVRGRRIGAAAGTAAVLATPVGFWATFPKRHAFTTLLALGAVYAFFLSRDPANPMALVHRALAYACVGFAAWIHAAEAFVLFVPLVVLDLLSAPSNDRRSLAVVAAAFLASLLPFLLTNAAISGDPLAPPRLLSSTAPGVDPLVTGGPGPGVGSGGSLLPGWIDRVLEPFVILGSLLSGGVRAVLTESWRVYHTFLRGGYIAEIAPEDGWEALNMTVLETAPVLAALASLPALAAGRLRHLWRSGVPPLRGSLTPGVLRDPIRATDALVAAYALAFVLVYQPSLPLHAQVTVRYLLPVYPLCVYGVVRLPAVGAALSTRFGTFLWSWTGAVLVGGQLLVAVVALVDAGLGEAIQIHAWLGLAAAGLVGTWAVIAVLWDGVPARAGAVCLGLAAGTGTAFLLLSGLEYFAYAGEYALPAVRAVAGAVSIV